ncbi:MAG TPA: DNA (cytosine-5-)-methyltransferase [Pyrinomonadaceae bacterium]|nr:DNA (cytosine-5-)-methyltransferase [Pyrinomonadaceae bacterium]
MAIPIIDLFAGPGGLGEGFTAFRTPDNKRAFKIKLSIEKDEFAHHTLQLRAFFRQFDPGDAPLQYYDYLARRISRDQLFSLYPTQSEVARNEAWLAELGSYATSYDEIDKRIQKGIGKRTKWLLIGGPPCQAYSLVGRSRIRGASPEDYENDHRHFLYREYLRILAMHQPPVFVMENVKGLLSATVKEQSIFNRIVADLTYPTAAVGMRSFNKGRRYRLVSIVKSQRNFLDGFDPRDLVVRTEDFAIPQARHRVIILGIRDDVAMPSSVLTPSGAPTIEETIGDLPRLRSSLSKEADSGEAWRDAVQEVINTSWFSNGDLHDDVRAIIASSAKRITCHLTRGDEYLAGKTKPAAHEEWYVDAKLEGVVNHATRGHIRKDLHRYLFAAAFAKSKGRSPLLQDFPTALLPKHENVQEALKDTKFNDRFRVQIAGRPSTTITSHISKDGHYFIHYDPSQCRSLTVREAARLQTFPDNYFFEGPRTEQYRQVGNAVPPLLAKQIAEIVADLLN